MSRRRIRWIALATLLAFLVAGVAAYFFGQRLHPEPWQLLAQVQQLEQAAAKRRPDQIHLETLGWSLAMLGRDDEVRRLDVHPHFESPPSAAAVEDLKLNVIPWQTAIADVADNNRVVLIMEDHSSSKHREFISATLPAFKDAGFTYYAAEAIGQFDASLAERGYPNKFTGLYTSDPQFGNALRRALELKFTIVGYDFRHSTHEEREDYAAAKLANLFRNGAETKLLVHAGPGHVLKHETTLGQRWLASLLWEKTGIEPFTIWQWSAHHNAHDYDAIVSGIEARGAAFDEPVLLVPPPHFDSGLRDSPYRLASVDAIVVHPPDESVAPAKRTPLFPDDMQRLAGRWTGKGWPVVISAYPKGEPTGAIPLDQVMLRPDETEFVLWIPKATDYEIRVFSTKGVLPARIDHNEDAILVGL